VFGQAVAREKARRTESDRREPLSEGGERRRMNGFGAAARHAPARQIQSFQIAILHTADRQVVREIGGKTDRGAIARDGFSPLSRAFDERLWRQEHAGREEYSGPSVHADQAMS